MVTALVMMGGLGLVVGIGLAAASKIFYVYVDPLILAVDDELPGANCGGCGMPGCSANAEAIVAGEAAPNSCVAAGPEVAEAIAAILGVSVEAKEPDIALPGCTYGVSDADTKYVYDGLSDCRAAALLSGGMKVCSIGCMGLGSCAKACPFDAIVMNDKGLPEVIEEKCTGCGTCERVCPKNIINLSSVTRRILKEYTTDDCTTPCQRECPAGINISKYIGLIAEDDYSGAVQVIKERNPFPTVIGRICPRPCENECRRKHIDEPVAINFLKRYAADYEMENNQRSQPSKAPATGRKVAVVGGGVQGLSTAFFIARLGHDATVFEATDRLGGLLNTAIAKYRLPEKILAWDVEGILEMGVTAETGKTMGRDFTIDTLLSEGYEAVFLAAGGWDSRSARGAVFKVEEPVPGLFLMLDLLKSEKESGRMINCGKNVVILNAGELAGDAIKKCNELGAEKITLMIRENEPDSAIKQILPDNVTLVCNAGVTRLFGTGHKLSQIEYADLETGAGQILSADTLILPSGRLPEMTFSKTESEDANDNEAAVDWTAVPPYKQPAFSAETGLLAPGDPLSDFSGAIKAIAAGRRSAATIHKIIYDIPLDLPDNVLKPVSVVQNVDHVERVDRTKRNIMPLADSMELAHNLELEKGFDAQTAKQEAQRCLQCGLICYRHSDADHKAIPVKEAVNA